ncbi:hypothetical protein Xen7305DRAFT_00002930 [Xenococcus sp. PCC 7305]|uniref:DUF6930 domain-containing protein n=1 Tax=Xenococcus sp. PCC 7305 TaxID=102125 RepID=UPI0002AD05A4|nr:hypothetical protein [Xenococcus sp. PCC 7305]ELS00592.1 hypothetical protein Xen7305DRAFT_00002930 [Xenococcus sp. PCC 7305]
MNALPQNTQRRLQKIPQNSSVWEGDRRPLGSISEHFESDAGMDGECVIWVDGTEGTVRGMEIVPAHMGLEAVVRTLLRAIESPHHPATPVRPQKIVVRDRQLQFFLRGALQGLDINIEYFAELPLIDQLFASFEEFGSSKPPALPAPYEPVLEKIAYQIWETEPWAYLLDRDIIALKIEDCEIETIYVCVMGNLGTEFGVLLYRSEESLKQFRQAAIEEESPESLEKAFLAQNCWFLNYEEEDEAEEDWSSEEFTEVKPFFGSLHPFEGMRAFLDAEEAEIVYLALTALLKFCGDYSDKLMLDPIPEITKTYRIRPSQKTKSQKATKVEVCSLPGLTAELLGMEDEGANLLPNIKEIEIPIQDDFIPDGSLITMGKIPWDLLGFITIQKKTYYQTLNQDPIGEGLPSIIIQTSRPKAKSLIEIIKDAGGLKAICFNPGNDPFSGEIYDLGMLQTQNGNLYIFSEYSRDSTPHAKALQRWQQSCAETKGYCSLIISMGVTGASRGNPQPKDMLAVFETQAITGAELGMGTLQLMPQFEFE